MGTLEKMLLIVSLLVVTFTVTINAGLLDKLQPVVKLEHFNFVQSKDGYHFNIEDPNGSKREEVGMLKNAGTPDEELVVMGSYSTYDDETGSEVLTMYTADKNGYQSRNAFKNRKLQPKTLKTLVR